VTECLYGSEWSLCCCCLKGKTQLETYLQASHAECWRAEGPFLQSGMECSAEQLTSCYGQRPTFVHCMGIGPKQQQLNVLDCEQQIRSCLVCKRHLAPSLHGDCLRLLEGLHSALDRHRDRRHMGCSCVQIGLRIVRVSVPRLASPRLTLLRYLHPRVICIEGISVPVERRQVSVTSCPSCGIH
jgi:hypothetical protein